MIDDFCKQLVARHPASISRWLLGLTAAEPSSARAIDTNQTWQLLDRELSSDALHADSVILFFPLTLADPARRSCTSSFRHGQMR